MKVSIIMPTNGKRINLIKETIESLEKQDAAENTELVIVSEGTDILNTLGIGSLNKRLKVRQVEAPKNNGILKNLILGALASKASNLFFIDDDVLFKDSSGLSKMVNFLEKNPSVWAVGSFIDENIGESKSAKNILYNLFKRAFRLWDPEDSNYKVLGPYGKGSVNSADCLPNSSIYNCEWLSNAALMIRKNIFLNYCTEDIENEFEKMCVDKLWATDFYLMYRLYLKNEKAMAFLPDVSVLHTGVSNTSFDLTERIRRETLWGFYYYKKFFYNQNIFLYFVLPNIGRLIDVLVRDRAPLKEKTKRLKTLLGSYVELFLCRKIYMNVSEYYKETETNIVPKYVNKYLFSDICVSSEVSFARKFKQI